MSIIYSYPTTSPTLDDLLIGTDVGEDNATKSFTVQSLVSLINAAQETGVITDVTISTTDIFLQAIKTSQPGAAAITYTVGLTSLPTAGLETTQFLRGDNQWVVPTVSAGISVFNQGVEITSDVPSINFMGTGVTSEIGTAGQVVVTIDESIGAVSSVTSGTGISIEAIEPNPTGTGDVIVTNTGVTRLGVSTGLSLSANTGNVVISLDAQSGGGTVTSVSAGSGLKISNGTPTTSPTIAVEYAGAQNVIAQGLNPTIISPSDQILFNQVSTTPSNVKSTTLATVPIVALPLVKDYIDGNENFISNVTDIFATAIAKNAITLEQSQYNGLATKDANTLYFTTNAVVTATQAILAIDTSNIALGAGVPPNPWTFTGNQIGDTKTGQPGASIANPLPYSSNLVVDLNVYEWLGGSVPVITNATGNFPLIANSPLTVSSTFSSNTTLNLITATTSNSILNTTFLKSFTLTNAQDPTEQEDWTTFPSNLITTTYLQSPAPTPTISGAPNSTYNQNQEWGVGFSVVAASGYTMDNPVVTYDPPTTGIYNNSTVTATLSANFTAVPVTNAFVKISDLTNGANSGAGRNTEYRIGIEPNPNNGASGPTYLDPSNFAQPGTELIQIPIAYAPYLNTTTVTNFTVWASTNSINTLAYQFTGTPNAPLYGEVLEAADNSPENTFIGPSTSSSIAFKPTIGGTNIVSFTVNGDTILKNTTSRINNVNVAGFTNAGTGGTDIITAQYSIDDQATWVNGGAIGGIGVAIVPVDSTVLWRYQFSPSVSQSCSSIWYNNSTVQVAMTATGTTPSAGATVSGPSTALSNQTGSPSTGVCVIGQVFNTGVIATHITSATNTVVSSDVTITGTLIVELVKFTSAISTTKSTALIACCNSQRNQNVFVKPANFNANVTPFAANNTLYEDALGLNPLTTGFYQVTSQSGSTQSSIELNNDNGVISTSYTQCNCVTLPNFSSSSIGDNQTPTSACTAVKGPAPSPPSQFYFSGNAGFGGPTLGSYVYQDIGGTNALPNGYYAYYNDISGNFLSIQVTNGGLVSQNATSCP